MSGRKHLKKIHPTPRTDANQNVREHIERVRKQNEYIARKVAEYKARMAEEERRRAEAAQDVPAPTEVDGLQDPDNE